MSSCYDLEKRRAVTDLCNAFGSVDEPSVETTVKMEGISAPAINKCITRGKAIRDIKTKSSAINGCFRPNRPHTFETDEG